MSLAGRFTNRPVRLTKAGWLYVVSAILTGVASYSSGNNVLFLGLSFLLSGLLLNGLISWWNFSRLHFEGIRSGQSRCGNDTASVLDTVDSKKILPSYGLIVVIEITAPFDDKRRIRRFVRRSGKGCFVGVDFQWSPKRRGIHRIDLVHVESTYPFGLIRKTFPMTLSRTVRVWPSRVDVARDFEFRAADSDGPTGSGRLAGQAMEEIEGLRDYRRGDPMRHIHWKKTAQSRRPVVKFGRLRPSRPQYCLAFDFEKSHFSGQDSFEYYCGFVGSLAENLVDEGKEVQVILHNGDPIRVDGYDAWCRLMDELSVIEPKVEAFPDTFVRKAGFNVVSPGDVFRAGAPGRDGFAGGRSQPVAIRRQEVVK